MRSRRPRSCAFTLVELLVVIAIIALLMAILLPALGRLQAIRKNSHCQKNLSDVHKALIGYCSMNRGRYPYPVANWFGDTFYGTFVPADPWAGLGHVQELMRAGAGPEIFYCPFNDVYGDWDAWPAGTWKTPFRPSWSPDQVRVYTGYALLTYRGYPYTALLTDGRWPAINDRADGDTPIVADRLHVRLSNYALHGGWWHGGGWPDGLFNADCNTLFHDGYVLHTSAGEFDWEEPGIVMGSSSQDAFWFALDH